jgi:hypothetical protein
VRAPDTHLWGARFVRGLLLIPALAATLALAALQPAPAGAETCPNAQFRNGPSAALPDCRAYELVTPPYKEGYKVVSGEVSADGSSVLGESLGTFAGTENDDFFFSAGGLSTNEGAQYVFTRGGSGWSATAIDPPASQYPESDLAEVSSGFESSLWFGATPAQVAAQPPGLPAPLGSLYLRGPDGSNVEVGPIYPPGTAPASALHDGGWVYDEASADLSRALFSGLLLRWPGDPTVGGSGSLYEYVGTHNAAPSLVGVSGGAGSSSLISQCQTELGTGEEAAAGQKSVFAEDLTGSLGRYAAQQLHTLSASGETVFFTAVSDAERHPAGRFEPQPCSSSTPAPAVNELYARVENGEPGVHTVAISEPSREDCSACETFEGEPAKRSPAYFIGASEDGSKVFFQTTQPLLGGDTSTNIYEYDFDAPAGQRVVRVSGGDATVANPAADVLQAEDVYGAGFGEVGVRGVERVSADGSHVYFDAAGVLSTVPNGLGETAQEGASNMYVFERDAQYPAGHTAFIATVAPFKPELSANGRFLVFDSASDLTPDDTSGAEQLFEYDAGSGGAGSLTRVSIGQDGYGENGNTNDALDAPHQALVANHGAVFFDSGDGLTPDAVDNVELGTVGASSSEFAQNVYEYREGNVYLISDGRDLNGSALLFIDPSGSDVFFETRDQLVPQDGDTQLDLYDARVDGGFPAPSSPTPCEGDACQGELSGAPTLLSPGSELQAGVSPPSAVGPVSPVSRPAAKKQPKKQPKKKAKRAKKRVKAARRGHGRGKAGRS